MPRPRRLICWGCPPAATTTTTTTKATTTAPAAQTQQQARAQHSAQHSAQHRSYPFGAEKSICWNGAETMGSSRGERLSHWGNGRTTKPATMRKSTTTTTTTTAAASSCTIHRWDSPECRKRKRIGSARNWWPSRPGGPSTASATRGTNENEVAPLGRATAPGGERNGKQRRRLVTTRVRQRGRPLGGIRENDNDKKTSDTTRTKK